MLFEFALTTLSLATVVAAAAQLKPRGQVSTALPPAASLSLPTGLPGGAWRCCFLRLKRGGWAQLAGLPASCVGPATAKLLSLGCYRVVQGQVSGSGLTTLTFHAPRSVPVKLSRVFPVASALPVQR